MPRSYLTWPRSKIREQHLYRTVLSDRMSRPSKCEPRTEFASRMSRTARHSAASFQPTRWKEANKNDKHGEHGDEHVDDEHGDGDGGDDCGGGNAVGNSVSADDDGHDGNGGDIGVVAMVWNCTTLFPFPPFGAPGAKSRRCSRNHCRQIPANARNGKSKIFHRHDALSMLNQHAFLIWSWSNMLNIEIRPSQLLPLQSSRIFKTYIVNHVRAYSVSVPNAAIPTSLGDEGLRRAWLRCKPADP